MTYFLQHYHTKTTLGPRDDHLSTHHDTESDCAMADDTPAPPSLQGIPPELRNKIYDQIALTEPRNVSGRKLLELRRQSPGGDLWKQFQLATTVHPLTMTCRQMRTELSPVLATTARQTYHLIVDDLDLNQLELSRQFVAKYCFSHIISDKTFPPLLFHEVVLCPKLDSDILPSVEAYRRKARAESYEGRCVIPRAFSKVLILHEPSSSGYDSSISKSNPMTKAQAKLARGSLRRMGNAYDLYEPDLKVIRLLVGHLTEMVDNHWPVSSDEVGDAWRSLRPEATLKVVRRPKDSTEPEVCTKKNIFRVVLLIAVAGILRLMAE